MIIVGYILAILMGLTLGFMGAGGAILTMPILVYIFSIKPIIATSYSLLIVGITALIGAISYYRFINIKAIVIFIIPSTISILASRIYILPNIPEMIMGITKDSFIMLVFSIIMLIAAFLMTRDVKLDQENSLVMNIPNITKLIITCSGVGLITGIVGAGGGFLIVPTLILLFALSVRESLATSLAIIAINSLSGFLGDLSIKISIDWQFLFILIGFTLMGMILGTILIKNAKNNQFKKIFAWFLILAASVMIVKELILNFI